MKPSKQELKKLYDKHTTYELAEIFKVNRTTVSNWLRKYNIDIRNKYAQFKKNSEIRLTPKQKDFLLGTMLGDGHISVVKSKRLARFSASHSIKQIEYLEWKSNILKNISRSIKTYSVKNRQNNKIYKISNLYTKATADLLKVHELFYDNGKKVIRPELIHMIHSPLSLAVWIMDDGSMDSYSKRINICSDSFTANEHMLLKNILLDNFNLDAKIIRHKDKNRLHFTVRETRKLVEIIEPHVLESMRYKILI